MKFSILLSVYRNEKSKFLKDSIESISLKQSIQPAEIVLIKDGLLTKELEDIIARLQLKIPYLKVYGYKENRGLGYALNYGLDKCSNDVIFRMDTDDIAVSDRFEKQLSVLKNNSKLAVIGGYMNEFEDETSKSIGIKKVPLSEKEIKQTIKLSNPFNHPTVLFKKSIVQRVGGYSSDFLSFEDYELWARIIKEGYEVLNIPIVLVNFRVNKAQISRRKGTSYIKKEFKLIRQLNKLGHISLIGLIRKLMISIVLRIIPNSLFRFIITQYRRTL